jgi:EAL domain-containing protein (putative c-di-GMP-specific phosphodiesterase class I)
MAEDLRRFMDDFHFKTSNRTYHIGASIGIAPILPGENINTSEILARANQACFVAKTHGRNMVHIFNQEDAEVIILRSAVYWVPRIRDALTNNKFRLLFQPVINLSSGEIERYEALIRMIGDDGDLITPNNFIPIAERMGLIHDIDLWVVGHAIDVLHNLPAEQSHLSLNINLSRHAFQDPALLPLVRDKLHSTGIDANRITFEITETAAVANFEQTREMVCQLRELGCGFALDDFGAGFSSFTYLKHFPVDFLKIDGAFITNLVNDPIDQTLVKSIIEIARTLGKHTVAEFVESAEVLNMLKDYGIDYAQGYHIGKPAEDFREISLQKLLTPS